MDYSRILVTDNKNLLFIAREVELMPSAIADYAPGDRAKINERLAEKVRHMKTITDAKKDRQKTLDKHRIQIESYAMAGVHTKAINHAIQIGYTPTELSNTKKELPATDENYDPIDDM